MEQVTFRPTFPDWQNAARSALQRNISPNDIVWQELLGDEPALDIFEEADISPNEQSAPQFRVPKAFLDLARTVSMNRDPRRWALLYRILWRLTHGEPKLLEVAVDPDVALGHGFGESDPARHS